MDLTYVDTHLTNVKRQFDGWPVGISKEDKKEATEAARAVLDQFPEGVSLNFAYRQLENRKIKALKDACVWDYLYAVTHRALLAVRGSEQVWKISEEQRQAEKSVELENRKAIPWYRGLHKMEAEDTDNGRAYWVYTAAMCSSFPGLFDDCDGNYDVEQKLRKAGVIKAKNKTDSEYCQMWIYFSTERAGQNFIDRFNKWAEKQGFER